jgi:retron-type reverse transcriptase
LKSGLTCAFFHFHFHPSLSAFRKGFGYQTALLKIIEDWKKALDENKYIAAILMDLSKAFDCLPHDLILLKLEAYGLSEKSINLLNSYLSGRKQCVKVKNMCSSFETVYKGVPQGSILGPILFNFFINDIFYSVEFSTIYNYADDNTDG